MAIADFSNVCEANSGGIRRIAFVSKDEFDSDGSITVAAGEISALSFTVASGISFHAYDIEQDSGEWRENGEMVNGSKKYTEELEFYIRKNNTASRLAIENLVNEQCGVLAIVEDSNGTVFLLGYSSQLGSDRPLKMLSDVGGSGKELTDLAGFTVVMAAMSPEKAYPLDSAVTWATLTTPA